MAVWMASNASASALIASGVSAPGRAAHTWCEEQQAVEHGMQKDGRQVGAPHGPRIVRRKLRFQVWAGKGQAPGVHALCRRHFGAQRRQRPRRHGRQRSGALRASPHAGLVLVCS